MYREIFETGIEERAQAPAVRHLLARWQRLHEKLGFVPFAPFDPLELGPAADEMIVLVPMEDGDYLYAHYGKQVASHVGLDMTGQRSSKFQGPIGDFFRECNERAIASGTPLFTLHRSSFAAQVHLWERLVLPCRDEDGTPIVVIFSRPRELRDDLLSAILDASLDAIVAVRIIRDDEGKALDGEFIVANRRAAAFADLPIEVMLGSRVMSVFPRLREAGLWDKYVRVAETHEPNEFVAPYRSKGETRYFDISVGPLADGFMVTFADVTDRKKAEDEARLKQLEFAAANEALRAEIVRRQELEQELSWLATRDSLTGILNRRALTDGLEKALALAGRYGHPLALIALDLDHFKRVNDHFGHAGGDAVLKAAVGIMCFGLREDVDLVGRLGGEEFIAVLPHTGLTGAAAAAERMRAAFAATGVESEHGLISFTASFGVATWDGRESMDRLLCRADAALYRAKASGRNVVAVDEGGEDALIVRVPDAAPVAPEDSVLPFAPRVRSRPRPRNRSDQV
ncbi:diguanylate cyclase [Phreatobacter sp.]|uniref:sensor domain-containing diguanylate cyclase n=1 Tax=Phreatobacter sp. TaxID=1966341 RepID=UPI003F6FA5DD